MQNAFPTLGSAVLYLNGFHYGKHLDRLNFLARLKPEWVMSVANNMWEHRNDDDFYADLLDWAIPDIYAQTFNEQVTGSRLIDAEEAIRKGQVH